DIEADNVKISGAIAGGSGSPVTVNLRLKLKNTTIILRNAGRIEGDRLVLEGASEISDSTVEIDLPPGTVATPRNAGESVTIKGAKIKVTEAGGTGSGGSGKGQGQGTGTGTGTAPGGTATQPGDAGKETEAKE